MLPESLDIILLSLGMDGHIASLFPGNSALQQKTGSVVSVVGPKPPPERLTITPHAINPAKSTFLFARGKEKGKVLAEALKNPNDISSLPVRLVLDSTWVLDSYAANQLGNCTLK